MLFCKGKMNKQENKKTGKSIKGKFAFVLACTIAVSATALCGCKDDEQSVKAENAQTEMESKPIKEYKFPAASEENDLLKIATSIKNPNAKVCYLTFDDGPTREITPKVLEILKKYDVKATFFTLGKMLEANRDVAKQVVDEGHLLANHSYYHEYEQLYASADSFMGEIEKTQALIDEISEGDSFKLVRFPGGGHNAGSYGAVKQDYKERLKENGYYFVDWNCLNGDAEASLRTADQLLARVKETAIGKNIVVLMHDAAAKKTTPDALGAIIEYLAKQGYEFKRLDEIDYYEGGSDDESELEKTSDMIL